MQKNNVCRNIRHPIFGVECRMMQTDCCSVRQPCCRAPSNIGVSSIVRCWPGLPATGLSTGRSIPPATVGRDRGMPRMVRPSRSASVAHGGSWVEKAISVPRESIFGIGIARMLNITQRLCNASKCPIVGALLSIDPFFHLHDVRRTNQPRSFARAWKT
jgi:hypothetical protein